MILSSLEKTNMKSKKVHSFFRILIGLAITYILFLIFYAGLSWVGVSYPTIWSAITQLFNGMEFNFTMDQAGPLFNNSLVFLLVSIIFVVTFWMLGWQILRTGILAIALLSLAYLLCAVLLLIIHSSIAHAIFLGLISILFVIYFLRESNIRIYFLDRTYADVFLESLVASGFLFFIGRMLVMALV